MWGTPQLKAQLVSYRITDVDVVEAVDCYTTPRGQQPGSPNTLNVASNGAGFTFGAFHLGEKLLIQPLQMVVGGGQAGAFGSYRDGFKQFNKGLEGEDYPRRARHHALRPLRQARMRRAGCRQA